MAQHTASINYQNNAPKASSRGKSPSTPIDCVGCGGPKQRKHLFCKRCRLGFKAARRRDRELDEMFERAISNDSY